MGRRIRSSRSSCISIIFEINLAHKRSCFKNRRGGALVIKKNLGGGIIGGSPPVDHLIMKTSWPSRLRNQKKHEGHCDILSLVCFPVAPSPLPHICIVYQHNFSPSYITWTGLTPPPTLEHSPFERLPRTSSWSREQVATVSYCVWVSGQYLPLFPVTWLPPWGTCYHPLFLCGRKEASVYVAVGVSQVPLSGFQGNVVG